MSSLSTSSATAAATPHPASPLSSVMLPAKSQPAGVMEKTSKNSWVLAAMSLLAIFSAVSYTHIYNLSYDSRPASAISQQINTVFKPWSLLSNSRLGNVFSSITGSKNLTAEYAQACPTIRYNTRIFSYDPLIIYIEDFVTPVERRHILNLAEEYYSHSTVATEANGTEQFGLISDFRTSQSAILPFQTVGDCLLQRAADFQGSLPFEHMEPLQVVKYAVKQKFDGHFDWREDDFKARISTFFVYAECTASDQDSAGQASRGCTGGETWFPEYEEEFDSSWCKFIDCEDKNHRGGVAFKAIPGNAVFWSNVHANGTYHEGVLHAGLPVESGQKIGINIWTRNGTAPWTGRGMTPEEVQEHTKVREEEEKQFRQEKEERERQRQQIKEIKEKLRLLSSNA